MYWKIIKFFWFFKINHLKTFQINKLSLLILIKSLFNNLDLICFSISISFNNKINNGSQLIFFSESKNKK